MKNYNVNLNNIAKNLKGKLVRMTIIGVMVGGLTACNTTSKKNTKPVLPTIALQPTATPKVEKEIITNDKENTTNKVTPTIVPTQAPVVEETVTEENTIKLDVILDSLMAEYQEKGVDAIDRDMLKDTFFLTNIDVLTKNQIQDFYPNGLDIDKVINNACSYVSIITTHNIINSNDLNKFIYVADLCVSEEDRQVLLSLTYKYLGNQEDINNNKQTSEDFHKSFDEITQFYLGNKNLMGGQSYYDNLTSGAQFLAESEWPMFNIQYFMNENLTSKEEKLAIYLTKEEVNGHKFMGRLKSFNIESCKTK